MAKKDPAPGTRVPGKLATVRGWASPPDVAYPEKDLGAAVRFHLVATVGSVKVDDGSGVRYLCGERPATSATEVVAPLDHPRLCPGCRRGREAGKFVGVAAGMMERT